ncbi:hypothetical protein [Lacinutrix sp. Bg11-31]|uniref:hypothetical protein n=1 Tax=Lacinutrix sp. Bg11-31 TaxID=2057808 RepID=UPI000C307F73|nr:hypothetical protein [Lacinutrix sp. Bg11-31]AUC82166.1 hypothetical protein CW733_08505 [Lacinutrix sp. Bg11-31]
MLILGTIETGVFITGYFLVNNTNNVNSKLETYQESPKDYLEKDKLIIDKNLKFFFILKCIYAMLFFVLAIIQSKTDIKSISFGISTALMIHFAMATIIDTFGERYTKIYKKEIVKSLKNETTST